MLNYGQIIEAAVWSRLKAEDFVEFLQAADQFSYKLLIESSTQSLFGIRQCLSPRLWLWWQAKQKCSGSIFYLQHWWRMKFSFWLQLLRLKRSRCVILFFYASGEHCWLSRPLCNVSNMTNHDFIVQLKNHFPKKNREYKNWHN